MEEAPLPPSSKPAGQPEPQPAPEESLTDYRKALPFLCCPVPRQGQGKNEPPSIPLACCPNILQGIVDDVVGATGAPAALITAAALATAAAALGPKVRLARSRGKRAAMYGSLPAAFNLSIFHQAPRGLSWFEVITAPLVKSALDLQAALYRIGIEATKEEITQRGRDLLLARHSVNPNPKFLREAEAQNARLTARLKPAVITTDPSFQNLSSALALHSFDQGVTLMGIGNDPAFHLTKLKASERQKIAELLNRSWEGLPLQCSGNRVIGAGSFSLLLATRTEPSALTGRSGFDPAFMAVPVLMLEDTTTMGGGAEKASGAIEELPHEKVWKDAVEGLWDFRSCQTGVVYSLSQEAEKRLGDFAASIGEALAALPAHFRPHVVWLPELAWRMALLLWILSFEGETVISEAVAADAVELTRWLGMKHLETLLRPAGHTDGAAATDSKDPLKVMLRKIRTKGPLTRRQLRRSFDDQRTEWFDPLLDHLLESGQVRCDEHGKLAVGS